VGLRWSLKWVDDVKYGIGDYEELECGMICIPVSAFSCLECDGLVIRRCMAKWKGTSLCNLKITCARHKCRTPTIRENLGDLLGVSAKDCH